MISGNGSSTKTLSGKHYGTVVAALTMACAKTKRELHKIAKLVTTLFNDEDWRHDLNLDDARADEVIDSQFLCALGDWKSWQLRLMFDYDNSKAAWSGNLRSLFQQAFDHKRTSSRAQQPTRTRKVVTKKEHEEVVRDRDHLKSRINFLQSETRKAEETAQEKIMRLEAEVERLEAENKLLRKQLDDAWGARGRVPTETHSGLAHANA